MPSPAARFLGATGCGPCEASPESPVMSGGRGPARVGGGKAARGGGGAPSQFPPAGVT